MIKDKYNFEAFSKKPISLMSDSGEWLADFELDLDDKQLKEFYYDMLFGRLLDERYGQLHRLGKVSFYAPSSGHEAAQIAIAKSIEWGHDWVFPYYRDNALLYSSGVPLRDIMAQMLGTKLDPAKARQMPSHPSSKKLNMFTAASGIASHIPAAAGAAIAAKIRNRGEAVITTSGEGATSEGDYHAGINFAGAQGAPIVFIVQNNGLAISVPYNKQSAAENTALKAHAYGMPGYFVDGMDILACYYVMQDLLARARAGLGPAMVEMKVYRYGPHSPADDDMRYRSKEEVDAWRKKDPLLRMQKFLAKRKLWTKKQDQKMREEITKILDNAIIEAESEGFAPLEWMFDDVFKEKPSHLIEQQKMLLED
ncbi:MAG TPA: thiamine pyrophosphate-dependent dehydrogenase E1 component subunit alpha [Trueperaceae bacterium]|nr:thiamine pyrophosphate-dependent dehydrogenase E1 component subunit alpha [Trueperaceae bacterium]